MSSRYDLVIGLDRADRKADLRYLQPASGRRWTQTLDTAPERLHDWLADLRQRHPKARVALCLEQPAGNLIPFLETYSWITLYPINPLTLLKYRERIAALAAHRCWRRACWPAWARNGNGSRTRVVDAGGNPGFRVRML